ncbi:MAG: hypothetical protein P4L76_01020, partial [Beijerinckiaceae bacterium]|nr:hypothetical protein [Beijerinckiaceae bacterium]
TAQGTVMLITDGVQDSDWKTGSAGNWSDGYDSNFTPYSPCVNATCEELTGFAVPIYIQAFNPANCAAIKTKNYTMMTLNVQYIVPPSNLQSSSSVLNDVFTYINTYLISSISTNMASCATSSSYAYSANTPAEIETAVATMFASAAVKARITQ